MFNVVLLWHMHQPYYVNPLTQVAMMPWVRLHSVKGYLDMIDTATRFPELRMNFNFSPVLVLQLLELAEKRVTDLWESWSREDAESLTEDQKKGILENFFKINWEHHIFPFPRYRQLLEIRGREYTQETLRESVRHFSVQDYRDLQTWFNLSWCGFTAQRRYPELVELKKKGAQFTEKEKNRVLDIHEEIVAGILKEYRQASERGQIELTTTPFYHPIMPLVYDTDFARRCMPQATLPPRLSAPEDVSAHLRMAQEQHTQVFGKPARGLWPSEGSVCPEVLPLMREAGFEYFCTDEGVLFASLAQDPAWQGRNVDHLELFQAWACEHEGVRLKAIFRERPLSDFVGFNAARNPPSVASDHLLHHLEHLADVAGHLPYASACLALDGENAWEAFADGGEAFLCQFYQKVLISPKLKTRLMGEYFDSYHECATVTRLHSGSWINSDFDIWIGDAEENQGWDWIRKTRDFLVKESSERKIEPALLAKAWQAIYAAEGSDWFWWYGPDFQTDCDVLFDELFRTHLQNVYRILGVETPKYLDIPICIHDVTQELNSPPTDYIHPPVNGLPDSFFDWLGAGRFAISKQQTAMFQADRMVTGLDYGFSQTHFYFRLHAQNLPSRVVVQFHKPNASRVVIDLRMGESFVELSEDGVKFEKVPTAVKWKAEKSLEFAVPMLDLGWKLDGTKAGFMVQIFQGDVEKERYPERGLIEFATPSSQFRLKHWLV